MWMKRIVLETRITLTVQVFLSSVLDVKTWTTNFSVTMFQTHKLRIGDHTFLEEILNIFKLLALEKFKTDSDDQVKSDATKSDGDIRCGLRQCFIHSS